MGLSFDSLKSQIGTGFSGLVDAGFQNLQDRYLSAPGTLNAPAATVTGNNMPVTAGVRQPVSAATPAESPVIAPNAGMSPLMIAGLVLLAIGGAVVIVKVMK